MSDPDRATKLKVKIARLEEQLTKSEKALDAVLKQLKSSRTSEKKEAREQVTKLTKDLEDQREEFEALIGRMNEEIQAVQKERDELALRLEQQSQPPKKRRRAAFEDEPTSNYTHQEMKDVVKREMFVAEEEPFFEDEEVTASHAISPAPGNKDQES